MAGTGVALAREKLSDATQKTKVVLDILRQTKALSLMELMSYVDVPDQEVIQIVSNLEKQNLVKRTEPGTLDEIVAIREQGLRSEV